LMGTMLAYFDLKGDLVRYFRGKQKLLYLILTLMLVCIFICFKAIPTEGFGGIYIHSYLVIFYGILFLLTLSSDAGTYLIQFLSNSLMAFIAKLSFMIYLSHQLFSGLLHQLILNQEPQLRNYKDLGVTSLALVITIIFSSLSYRYFEKPILNYAKRFTYFKPSTRNIKPET
jgi:peptidoglycan/LPS O-acetylase OafA/YrhL